MGKKQQLLEWYREIYPNFLLNSVVELKGKYISPKERKIFEMFFGREIVTDVFGEPTYLERVEMLLDEMEKRKMTSLEKIEILINIIHEFQKEKNIKIPIIMLEHPPKEEKLNFFAMKTVIKTVTIGEMKKIQKWMSTTENIESEPNSIRKAYVEYMLERLHISIRKIFEERKNSL